MQTSGQTIAETLLAWYGDHARTLPWRAPPGTDAATLGPDWPYRVWLSEVMLQQTTVAAVGPYFARFTHRWPTVAALAAADEAEVMSAWAGLGYYSRARNLIACARAVAARGGFPDSEAGLRELPGVGAYTAAAVAAIGFGRAAVPVDANIERVAARLFAIGEPMPGARPAIREAAERIAPTGRAGDFAQAMMDLGATICTTRAPRCLLCPLRPACAGHATGSPETFPLKAPKRAKPLRRGRAFWTLRDDKVWLVRRPPNGMLGGMRALPDDGWSARGDGSGGEGEGEVLGMVRHGFTHFDLELVVVASERTTGEGEWWPASDLDSAGLPTLFAKAASVATACIETANKPSSSPRA
ncbi:A/G-specific adenine glycosylase [Novosphingobium sp. Gsoil 351]|uniref:A/G-specific adenine glycosylase n=1 Tax=Novosphingobium sp. Gsoil 351 TaxID=2675225 RepID=UPI0012B46EEF|nr:A/G-specific adenine glycosylase [Novosphingobium sp. Gsoil 351]QGN54370.1 A/G-specific adenine glycosylase [Novosphingobium sp. Gsoil 351]